MEELGPSITIVTWPKLKVSQCFQVTVLLGTFVLLNYAGMYGCLSWNSKYFLEINQETYESIKEELTPYNGDDEK